MPRKESIWVVNGTPCYYISKMEKGIIRRLALGVRVENVWPHKSLMVRVWCGLMVRVFILAPRDKRFER